MITVLYFLNMILELYMLVMLLYCVFSFLFGLNILNPYQKIPASIYRGLIQLCEPVLMPIRRIMPDIGGIDISPVVVFMVIRFILQPLLRGILLS